MVFTAHNTNLDGYYGMYLVVAGELWGHGLGSLLYDHLLLQAADAGCHAP